MKRNHIRCRTGIHVGDGLIGTILGYCGTQYAAYLLMWLLSPFAHVSPNSVQRNIFDLAILLSTLFFGLLLALLLKPYPVLAVSFAAAALLGFASLVGTVLSMG